jgi:biofilm PGA synthesis N-glycosyltransferase PgaC
MTGLASKEADVSVDLRDRPVDPGLLPEPGLGCSVGIMAYNEEANIAQAIGSILGQKLTSSHITELIVVASGCEDRTAPIVAEIARDDPRVRLIEQERREGKASAINLFISAARSPILLMVSADVLVKDGTIEALVSHFHDPAVGMVGGHPTPVNSETNFLGHAVHLQWRLHDRIARQSPKLGEIVAFRNVVPSIPLDTAVDEISIQALITQLGYQLVYEPEAVVYNRGPTTVGDFLRQRRRIHAGHLRVREQQAYAASTMSGRRVLQALLGSGSFTTPRAALWSVGTVGLEAAARGLGHYDVMRRRQQHVWAVSATTKLHIAEGANAEGQQNVLVLHIVNFHRQQLELGAHASRQLTRRVTAHIKRALGSNAIVSIQRSGTIVALMPGDREAAERRARELVEQFETTPIPLNGHGATVFVTLACGVIAFPQTGPPLARSIPVPLLEAQPAASMPS